MFFFRKFLTFIALSFLFSRFSFARALHGESNQENEDESSSVRALKIHEYELKARLNTSCPKFLIDKVDKDAHSNLRNWYLTKAGSADDFCAGPVKNLAEAPNSNELSKRLAEHPLTKIGNNGETLSEECINSVKDPARKNFLIAEYYSNMARLKVASLASLESLQEIDSVLGEASLEDKTCSSVNPNLVRKGCEKLKSCKSQGGLSDQAKELESIYPAYEALKKEASDLRKANALSGTAMSPGVIPGKDQISTISERSTKSIEIENIILALEAMYPALKGKVFQKIFDPSKKNFEQAFRAQLKETRNKINGEFQDLQKATSCMCGDSYECNRFDETLKKTPPLDVHAFKSGSALTPEEAQVQTYLTGSECFQKVRKAKENQDEAVSSFSVNSGLTVLTLCLGSFASYGKFAYMAAQEAKATSVAVKASAQLLSKTKMASNVALGFDVFSLGKGGVDAYDKCKKDLNHLTSNGLNKSFLDSEVSCSNNPSQSSQAQIIADYRACVIHSVLAGASSFILPKSLKKTVEGPFKGLTKGVKKGVGGVNARDEEE